MIENPPNIKRTDDLCASKQLECAICMGIVSLDDLTTISLDCSGSCAYHQECLQGVFRNATTCSVYFPARCNCRIVIDLTEDIKDFLGDLVTDEYYDKQWRYLNSDRVYCWGPDCQAFIPPSARSDGCGQCAVAGCGKKTCVICGREMHEDDCEEDTSEAALAELGEGEGWQKCRHCGRWIEHAGGCNDIECVCGFRFCYVCGKPSGECECKELPREVIMRESALHNARLNYSGEKASRYKESEQAVDQAVCDHSGTFKGLEGTMQCEGCEHLSSDSYQCRRCNKVACYDCFRNRPHPREQVQTG
ncbi:hypothetical protein F4810DRAFT_715197 [Camillea tinctor]|nr:hypothetical protein F4810DRAFT_715197 [Camillea tinctor]